MKTSTMNALESILDKMSEVGEMRLRLSVAEWNALETLLSSVVYSDSLPGDDE